MEGSSRNISSALSSLELEVDTLKKLYEQYFAGLSKLPPEKEHKKVKQVFLKFTPKELKTTALKFRFQSIQTRYISLNSHWNRIMRQIEEGTYSREVFKMHQHDIDRAEKKSLQPKTGATDKKIDLLYEKVQKLADKDLHIPSKENFEKTVKIEMKRFAKENPGEKFQLRLEKEKSGELKVSIKSKK